MNWLQSAFSFVFKESEMTGSIMDTPSGYTLVDRNGMTVATYSRARDARRGAERRGFILG